MKNQICIIPDGFATVYGVDHVTNEDETRQGVVIWFDFHEQNENYKLLLTIEDAVYLRDRLNELEDLN